MKKIFFFVLILFINFSVVDAAVEDAKYVGGTGGAKVIDLSVEQNKVDTAGVIYDKDASLVYEIIYTNNSSNSKKVVDVKLPSGETKLKYSFEQSELSKVVEPGGTVSYTYKIFSKNSNTVDVLSSLNEDAKATLVFADYSFNNPETVDSINIIVCVLIVFIILFVYFRKKVIFYSSLVIILSILGFKAANSVSADGTEIVDIKTNVRYILSNLAPSCADSDHNSNFCVDWKLYGKSNLVHYLIMEDFKDMPSSYNVNGVDFVLENTYDVSEQQNNQVNLGIYKNADASSYLFLVGQDGGVVVSKNGSYQFTSYDSANNVSVNDFHFLKYVDFSKFYTNKTVDMSYMLTGIATETNIEYLDLTGFETSNVTNMKAMFLGFGAGSNEVILDLSHFDTSKVVDMSHMFKEAAETSSNVEINVANWNTSSVKNMSYMFNFFANCDSNIKLDIYNWDTSNVEDMSYMFASYNVLRGTENTIDYFKNWNTKNVKTVKGMFSSGYTDYVMGALVDSVVLDLNGFDVDSVEDFSSFVSLNTRLNKVIIPDDWNTSNAKTMNSMFYLASYITELNVSHFNTSNVTDMTNMFSAIGGDPTLPDEGIALDLSNWDVSKVNSFKSMFAYTNFKGLNLNGWDTSNAKDFSSMFSTLNSGRPVANNFYNYDLRFLDLSSATNYSSFFSVKAVVTLDLSETDWNESASFSKLLTVNDGSIVYVKDDKAKAFIEAQAPNVTVLVK